MSHRPLTRPCLIVLSLAILPGCYSMRPLAGGAETTNLPGDRRPDPAAVALPAGYRIEPVATGLTFPTGVTFDEQGRAYVVESGYAYAEFFTTPRLLRVEDGGRTTVVANCGNNGGAAGLGPAIDDKPLPGGLIKTQVRPGLGAMPHFSQQHISDDDLGAVVAYLQARGQQKPLAQS
jgi:hypothetical protein